jgi:hypothetical protein
VVVDLPAVAARLDDAREPHLVEVLGDGRLLAADTRDNRAYRAFAVKVDVFEDPQALRVSDDLDRL